MASGNVRTEITEYGRQRRNIFKAVLFAPFAFTPISDIDKLLYAIEAIINYGGRVVRSRYVRVYAREHNFPPELQAFSLGTEPYNEIKKRELVKEIGKNSLGLKYEFDIEGLKKFRNELEEKKGRQASL